MHSSDIILRETVLISQRIHTESMLISVSYINMTIQNKVLII